MFIETTCIGYRIFQVPGVALVLPAVKRGTGTFGNTVVIEDRCKSFIAPERNFSAQCGTEFQSLHRFHFQESITYYIMRPVIISKVGTDISQWIGNFLRYLVGNTIKLTGCIF